MTDNADLRDPDFWESRYREAADAGAPSWDIGGPAPPLARVAREGTALAPGSRVLVPGCGRGHDAVLFAEAGHEVLGVDLAPGAIAASRALAAARGVEARCRFEQGDLFAIGARDPGAFDAWIEHTCFCAIPPDRRADYARTAATALRPGGIIVGLFFPADARPDDDGPPFPVHKHHVESVFLGEGAPFEVVSEEAPADSVDSRRGRERLWVLRRV